MKLKHIMIFLIMLFCIIGAASAADMSSDIVDASVDDADIVDAAQEDESDSVESQVVEDGPIADDPIEDDPKVDPNHLVPADVIYVNVTNEGNNPQINYSVNGYSWEKAYGGKDYGLHTAFGCVKDGGIIYLSDGVYSAADSIFDPQDKSITFIGQSKNTIMDGFYFGGATSIYKGVKFTFKNLTLKNTVLNASYGLENCDISDNVFRDDYTKYLKSTVVITTSTSTAKKTTKVATKIVAPKKTFKAKTKIKKYTITLKTKKGKVIKKAKVTFKISNKVYKLKTNSKGKATFKIKKLKKKAKYTAIVIYGGSTKYKSCIKKARIIVK